MKRGHLYDDDGCCVYCNFDGAEASYLRSCTHPDEREPRPQYETVCEKNDGTKTVEVDDWDD